MKRFLLFAVLIILSACQTPPQSLPPVEPPKPFDFSGLYQAQFPDEAFLTTARVKQFQNLRIYEVMVESFLDGDTTRNIGDGYGTSHHKGDVKGIISALDYIQKTGFNALWVTPLFFVDGTTKLDGTGYYIRDYFKVDPHFGTLDDVKTLVKEAHNRGIYVFFDGVFGHFKKGDLAPSPSGLLPETDNGKTVFFRKGKVYENSIKFFQEVANYWIDEVEIDGWRLDMAYELVQGNHNFWMEIRQSIQDKVLSREAAGKAWGILGYMVTETWQSAQQIALNSYGTPGNVGVYSSFDFPVQGALSEAILTPESQDPGKIYKVAEKLDQGMETHKLYPEFALPNLMLGNHDIPRFGDRIQRAYGGDAGPTSPEYWARHRLAFAFQNAFTGPIMTYYGEEIGDELKAYQAGDTLVPDYFDSVKWSPETPTEQWGISEDHVSRTSGKVEGINITLNKNQKDLKAYLTNLFKLRQKYPSLASGARKNYLAQGGVYADLKTLGDENILAVFNFSETAKSISIPLADRQFTRATALIQPAATVPVKTGALDLILKGLSAEYYLLE